MLFNKYKKIVQSSEGRVFAIGDVHGCLIQLKQLLEKLQFDYSKDQVVFVGDLADRGPDSLDCIRFVLESPCFHLVVGNHEELLVESVLNTSGFIDAEMMEYWIADDGSWTKSVNGETLKLVADKLNRQSYYLAEVVLDSGTRFGITHAGYNEAKWYEHGEHYDALYYRRLVWSRKMAETSAELFPKVQGIDFTVHGHTIFGEPVIKGNAVFIDTGCFDSGKLTALNLGEFANTRELENSIVCTP